MASKTSRTILGFAVFAGLLALNATADARQSNVEIVLDASGSMNGRLGSGERKIDAAKQAVRTFVSTVDPGIRLALRAYGHQSHRSKKDCRDTGLLVDFGPAGKTAGNVADRASGLAAQGYTPITYVLGLAADDLKPTEGSHTIVLVSDGKETCEGDPCLLARKLAEADADLVIHTIGFGVDPTTRKQLECIARFGRGSYFPADGIEALSTSLTRAVVAVQAEPVREAVTTEAPADVTGQLEIVGADKHAVLDAETGEEVTRISYTKTVEKLEPGLYNVVFDNGLWKSVEVRAGETTVLEPAILRIVNGYKHDIVDRETGLVVSSVSSTADGGKAVLVPGRFDVRFEDAVWTDVVLEEGRTRVLEAARIRIKGAGMSGVPILDANDRQVAKVRSTRAYAVLPPGTYTLVLKDGSRRTLELAQGRTIDVDLR